MAWPLGYTACHANVIADGNAVAATTTQTSLLTGTASQGVFSLPANWLGNAAGAQFYLRASGRISTPAATQGNVTFTVVIGAVNACVSPTFTSQASQTNITWILDWDMTVRAVGSGTSANIMHTGTLTTALVSATNLINLIPATAPVVGTGFNSTGIQTVDLQLTWSNNTAGNTVTLHQYSFWSLINY
jgi:hypothetical protein